MIPNYFFIDGSALTAQIRRLRKVDSTFNDRKLDPRHFVQHFAMHLTELQSNEYKRATFYFPRGDEVAVNDFLLMPDRKKPGAIRDIHFKFCGEKLKGSAEFNKFVEENVPIKWQDRFTKSEKGIDIEICCDALKLASASRLERLFFLTNDDDFAPLCRTLREFGTNISLIHLAEIINPNESLLHETDSYDVIAPTALQTMFFPQLVSTVPLTAMPPESIQDVAQAEDPVVQPEAPVSEDAQGVTDAPNDSPKEA